MVAPAPGFWAGLAAQRACRSWLKMPSQEPALPEALSTVLLHVLVNRIPGRFGLNPARDVQVQHNEEEASWRRRGVLN